MFGAEKLADMFDEIHEDNKKAIERGLQSWVTDQYQKNGEGWQFYGAAVTAGVADALYTFAGGMGSGLVDTLRLGEGVKEGTAWGVAKDGLRVISVVGGSLRVLRLASAELKLGGAMTCTISSSSKAGILSGNWFRQGVLFERMAKLFGGKGKVMSTAFAGTNTPLELKDFFRVMGTRVTLQPVKTLDDVAKMAKTARGPVVFGVRWAGPAGMPGGGHTMVAFRNALGKIMYADQMGRTVSDVSKIGKVASVFGEAMLVHDAAMIQAFRAGTVGHFLANALYPVHPKAMKKIEQKVREKTGRPVPAGAVPPVNPPGAGVLNIQTNCVYENSDRVNLVCSTQKTYIVKHGDSLWGLAQQFYKDGKLYRRIYDANKGVLGPNPEKPRLMPGQNLYIP